MSTLQSKQHEAVQTDGISLALSEAAKHKCRAPSKTKGWLNIVIQGNEDPLTVILNIVKSKALK